MEVVDSPIPPPLSAVIPVKLPTPPPTLERPHKGTRLSRLYISLPTTLSKIQRPPRQQRAQSPLPPHADPNFDRQFYIPARTQ
jgi:hypothetical protein